MNCSLILGNRFAGMQEGQPNGAEQLCAWKQGLPWFWNCVIVRRLTVLKEGIASTYQADAFCLRASKLTSITYFVQHGSSSVALN